MLGTLTAAEIEALLHAENVGRIGCADAQRTYVVPISYAYDGAAIYGHSLDGLKLRMMRERPAVCFQIDRVEAVNCWSSVIAWGRYEELIGADAMRALQTLMARFAPQLGLDPHAPAPPHGVSAGMSHAHPPVDAAAFVYRIRIEEKTGRFERR